jgi:hypothetical protein
MVYLKILVAFFTSSIAIAQSLDKKKAVKIVLIISVLFLLGATVWMELITVQDKKDQDSQLKDLNNNMIGLKEKLDPFIEIAKKYYPNLAEKEALKEIRADLEKIGTRTKILENKAANYSTYAEVATWNFLGDKMVGAGVGVNSPVSGLMKDYVQDRGDGLWWPCDSLAIAHLKNIIEAQPNYPFPYYYLAICLKQKGDQTWQKYATEGIQILEKTTTIPGHDPGHDDALKRLKDLLKK